MSDVVFESELLVLGSGPAGCTAAIYAKRANVDVSIICGNDLGGQLMTTTLVDNWPGGDKNLTGPDLIYQMHEQLGRYQIRFISDHIKKVFFAQRPFELYGENSKYRCKSVIIATGARPRKLGLKSEVLYSGKGVSYCAVCDGFFYKDQVVAVIGGGNSALEDVLYLSNIAEKIYLIHRRDHFKGEPILVKQVKKVANVEFLLSHVLEDVDGNEDGVNRIFVLDLKTGFKKSIDVSGVFVAVGHIPNSECFKNQISTDVTGHIITKVFGGGCTATDVAGIFAAGDVTNTQYRQAVTAAGEGCMAAMDVEGFLSKADN